MLFKFGLFTCPWRHSHSGSVNMMSRMWTKMFSAPCRSGWDTAVLLHSPWALQQELRSRSVQSSNQTLFKKRCVFKDVMLSSRAQSAVWLGSWLVDSICLQNKIRIKWMDSGWNLIFCVQAPSTRRKSRRRRRGCPMRSCVFLPSHPSPPVGASTQTGPTQNPIQKLSDLNMPLCWLTAATRQSDWDGIVACHRGRLAATTWNYQRCTMGAHHLQPPVTRRDSIATVTPLSHLCFSELLFPHYLNVTWLPAYVSRQWPSLPVATLLWLAHHAAVSMSTTCNLACTVVAMAMTIKVGSPVLACDYSVLCVCLSLTTPLFC